MISDYPHKLTAILFHYQDELGEPVCQSLRGDQVRQRCGGGARAAARRGPQLPELGLGEVAAPHPRRGLGPPRHPGGAAGPPRPRPQPRGRDVRQHGADRRESHRQHGRRQGAHSGSQVHAYVIAVCGIHITSRIASVRCIATCNISRSKLDLILFQDQR